MSIGQNASRIDAVAKVTGAALYPGDLVMPNMAHMKILFARRPHAIVTSIDTSEAERAPGVIAVYTAKDVPNNEYGLIMPDQPVLIGPGSNKEWGDHVRFIGDQIALIVAETEKQAEHARDLIKVEYEDLPAITDPREAMKEGALQLHPDKPGNLLQHYRIRKGEVDDVWDKCEAIVVGEYQTPFQEHAYLQPEAGLGLHRRRRPRHRAGRRSMDARRSRTDRARAATAARSDPRDLSGHRRRVRRARRYVGADRAGVGRVEVAPARQDRVDARRIDHRASQAPPDVSQSDLGRARRRPTPRRASGSHRRCGRVCVHLDESAGQLHVVQHRPVRHPQRQSGYVHDLHEQHSGRSVPRIRRPAGRISGRDADEQAGRKTGHRSGGAAHEEHHA